MLSDRRNHDGFNKTLWLQCGDRTKIRLFLFWHLCSHFSTATETDGDSFSFEFTENEIPVTNDCRLYIMTILFSSCERFTPQHKHDKYSRCILTSVDLSHEVTVHFNLQCPLQLNIYLLKKKNKRKISGGFGALWTGLWEKSEACRALSSAPSFGLEANFLERGETHLFAGIAQAERQESAQVWACCYSLNDRACTL